MSDLVERLRELKAFAPNECRQTIDEAADEIERLLAERKRDCVEFFRWWWNQPGSNTDDGFDEWAALKGADDGNK